MSTPRILVVDDDRDNCDLTQRVLAKEGYEVDVAYDAMTALKLFGDSVHDLVVLDYRMPDMDGMDLLATMRSQYPEVAAVLYTAYATIDMINDALEAGAKRVIPKDVNTDELVDTVNGIVSSTAH